MQERRLAILFITFALIGCGPRKSKGDGPDGSTPPGPPDFAVPCLGLQCQQKDCGELGATTLVGKVYAPNGKLPLYNAVVYVPNADLEPFADAVTCDRCNGHVSGNPLVQAVTGPDGAFQLDNVPAGIDIPLVVQVGKWRRKVLIDVPECTTTEVDPKYTRLPKNQTVNDKEGNMPKLAIATGSVDPMECLLLKIGIDPEEIKEPGQGTRVEFYKAAHSPGSTISGSTPSAADPSKGIYTDLKRLLGYDVVIFPCEGGEYDQDSLPSKGSPNRSNLAQYLTAGGRVFATHYSYDWLTYPGSPYNQVAKPQLNGLWPKDQSSFGSDIVPTVAKLVTNFPKGMAFMKWLISAGAKSAQTTLNILAIRRDIDGVDTNYAQPWATVNNSGTPATPLLTFNTPPDAPPDDMGVPQYCGRVVYSDFHVAASESFGSTFPKSCKGNDMTDQEKALAFMLFDLSSCVQSDMIPPVW